MEKFTYLNSIGKQIEIAYGGNYLLDTYDGLTAAEVIPATVRGYNQNGYTLSSTNLGARTITLHFYIFGDTMEQFYQNRAALSQVFNPLCGNGLLTYENDYTKKSIYAVVSVPPTIENRMGNLQQCAVELTAYNPFWFDSTENAMRMADFQGGLKFPLKSAYYTFASRGDAGRITNYGDVATPVRIEFRGPAENPDIILVNTGEFIKVNTTIAQGEKLIITTDYGNKSVIKEDTSGSRTSAYHLITRDSTFFSLPLGENKLTFKSDAGEPEVYLYWRNLYTGV